ncbi:MAG TPA: hypothetical protein VMG41_08435 [Gemmatimonadales bacterium]|nr:hypothetical protein [Gemmatimonadales bacterium]
MIPLSSLSWRLVLFGLALLAPCALRAQDSLPPRDTTHRELPRDSVGQHPLPVVPGMDSLRDSVGLHPLFLVPSNDTLRDSLGLHPEIEVPTDSLGRPIIKYIEVRRANIFDSAEVKGFLTRAMNALHITTLPSVVTREILFHEGEPYDSAKVAETTRNLRALGVFRKVRIDSTTTDSGFVMKVFVQDGWSTQADLSFRSAGHQTDWQVSLSEGNLLGTASLFVTRYHHTPDRNSINFQFMQQRFLLRHLGIGLRYESQTAGKRGQVLVQRPFYSLEDKAGLTTVFDIRNEQVLQFRDGSGTAADSLRRRYTIGQAEGAIALSAGTRGYLRLGLDAQVRRDDYAPWPANTTSRSVTAMFGPFLEWRRANYVVSRGFYRMGRAEDVDVSNYGRIGLFAAPAALGYPRDGIGGLALARVGTRLSRGFAWIDARVNGVVTSAGLDSGSATLAGTFVYTPNIHHVLIAHADIGWLKNPLPGTEFDLGFLIGPRGFPLHAFTGDRTYFATTEYRYMLGEDIWKAIDLGVAAFADHGGAWWNYEGRRTGTDVGLGIRIGPSRAANANPTRLDFAYRFKNDAQRAGWLFVISSGLVFSTQFRQ